MSVCRVTCPYCYILTPPRGDAEAGVFHFKNERDFCLCVVYRKAIVLLILRGQVQMQINYTEALKLSKNVLQRLGVLRKNNASAVG